LISADAPIVASSTASGDPTQLSRRVPGGDDGAVAADWVSGATPTPDAPQWLAYDLSDRALADRSVVAATFASSSAQYRSAPDSPSSGVPVSYAIEGNAAPGGTVPTAGWSRLLSVTDNAVRARESIVDLSGYNWIRLVVTSTTDGGPLRLNRFDVRSLPPGLGDGDSWVFLGDAVTWAALSDSATGAAAVGDDWSSIIHRLVGTNDPNLINAASNADTVGAAAFTLPALLSEFPGRYVVIGFGVSDAAADVPVEVFGQRITALIDAVIAAGRTPIVAVAPWIGDSRINPNSSPDDITRGRIAAYNKTVRVAVKARPQVIRGPDLEEFFFRRADLVDGTGLTAEGAAQLRRLWACQALVSVYRVPREAVVGEPACAEFDPFLRDAP
jgi:hypothetical protein